MPKEAKDDRELRVILTREQSKSKLYFSNQSISPDIKQSEEMQQ